MSSAGRLPSNQACRPPEVPPGQALQTFQHILCTQARRDCYHSFRSRRFRFSESTHTSMSTIVKVQRKGQVTLPNRLRVQAGIADGDLMEATFVRGKIVLTPKVVIDRSQFPNADDEYTPEQRRLIDAGIRQGLEDFKKGRVHGPFATAKEASAYIERVAKEQAAAGKRAKRPRR